MHPGNLPELLAPLRPGRSAVTGCSNRSVLAFCETLQQLVDDDAKSLL